MVSTLIFQDVFVGLAKLARVGAKSVAPPSLVLFWSSVLVIFLLSYVYIKIRESRFIQLDHPISRVYRWIVTDSADQFVRAVTKCVQKVWPKPGSDKNISLS
ncbi:MAG: hypothetical protein AAF437_09005 [Pseudomonadota bacterium]